jgi:aldose 1-epimerase
MLEIAADGWEAALLPEHGATFARLAHGGRELLAPIPPGAPAIGPFHGAFLMAPWTNRLDAGRIEVAGRAWHMPINRPTEGTALHGLLRELPWRVESRAPDRATLACDLDHPPFRVAARLEAALAADGLKLAVSLTNTAAEATPLGIGWHPFFVRPPGTRLRFGARVVFGRDARNLPVAPRPCAGLDGGDAVLDGLDTHFAGWDGTAEITFPGSRPLVLRASGAWRANLQVFAPRGAGILAVEPVSHAPDSANRADAAAHGAMRVVESRGAIAGSLMIHRH